MLINQLIREVSYPLDTLVSYCLSKQSPCKPSLGPKHDKNLQK